MPQYMLLIYNDPTGFLELSPQEQQKGMEKYFAFGQKLRSKNMWVSSHKLADDPGRVMRNKNGKTVTTDGPYSETKEWLGGYYLIEAPNYEAAVEISRECPALEHGGTVEVREVDARVAETTLRAHAS
jgi:hypothetical protein